MIYPIFIKKNQTLDIDCAQFLWQMVHNPAYVSLADVGALVFGRGDPGDNIYGRWDFPAVRSPSC